MSKYRLNTKDARAEARRIALQGYTVTEYPDANSVAGIMQLDSGRALYKIFDGTAGRPSAYYSARNAESAQTFIDKHMEARRRQIAYKAEQKAKNKGNVTGAALTAKCLRARLKKEFPDTKFSVTSSTFSMGDSVDVSWTDGAPEALVEKVVNEYQNSWFDGMGDLSHSIDIDKEKLGCDGAKYTHTKKTISAERAEELKAHWEEHGASEHFLWARGDFNPAHYENETPATWAAEYQARYAEQIAAEEHTKADENAKREAEYQEQLKAIEQKPANSNVISLADYRAEKESHELAEIEGEIVVALAMMTDDELRCVVLNAAQDTNTSEDDRRTIIRVFLSELRKRDEQAALETFEEVRWLFGV